MIGWHEIKNSCTELQHFFLYFITVDLCCNFLCFEAFLNPLRLDAYSIFGFRKNPCQNFHQTPHRINALFCKIWKCQKANSFLSVKIIRIRSSNALTQCNVFVYIFFWNRDMDGDGMLISLCQKVPVNIVDKRCCRKTNCA